MRTVLFAVLVCLLACVLAPTASGNTLRLSVDDPYVKPGENVYVSLEQAGLEQPVSGVQAFMAYDNSLLTINSSSITTLQEPFGLMVYNEVAGTNIDVAVGLDVFHGQQPATADADIVNMIFTAGQTQGTTIITFRPHTPGTTFTDPEGYPVVPQLIDTPPITIDGTDPVITSCPADITVPNDPGSWGARTDVGLPIAVDDLSGIGEIVGTRTDGKALDDIYPIGLTTIRWSVYDRSGNVARCVQRVVVYAVGILEPVIYDPYVKPGENVHVSLEQSSLLQPASGYQAFLSFNTAMMSISKPDITFTTTPYGLPIYKEVDGGSIDLAAGINVFTGQDPTWDDAVLAVMKFTAGSVEGITRVDFRNVNPPSRFTDLYGESIYPALRNSIDVIIDGTAPSLSAPADVLVNAPQGASGTYVSLAPPSAYDQLSGLESVIGVRSDGLALNAVFPIGATLITWTATDRAGNSADREQLVVVAPYGFNGSIVKSVAQAKQLADGSQVALVSPICTRLFGSSFYVEDADRVAGIKVLRNAGIPVAPGLMPAVFGAIQTSVGERVVQQAYVAPYTAGNIPVALGTICRSTSSPLLQGLLVKLWGRVEVPAGASTVFVLDDGSPTGVRVRLYGLSLPTDGAYVTVTGVLGFEFDYPVLRVNHIRDITPVQH